MDIEEFDIYDLDIEEFDIYDLDIEEFDIYDLDIEEFICFIKYIYGVVRGLPLTREGRSGSLHLSLIPPFTVELRFA